ncbi:MAG TPA: hypothetical protein VJ489_00355 [Thermoplasmata archaeon]|nr:hypothetical protein [Thermoplasmata archaeon]
MVDILSIVAGVAGFGPSMGLLYYTLRNYTYPKVEKPFFDDRKLFSFFALGIVLGMLIFAFESWGSSVSSDQTLVLLIVLYALMECLMKFVILNFPRFQRKVDTAFYGLSLGLGIASTYTFSTIFFSLASPDVSVGVFEYVAFSLLGLPIVLVHGSTTTFIAIGVVRGDRIPYLSQAILVQLGYNLLMIPFFWGEPYIYFSLVGATAVALYSYHKIYTLSLPVLIKDAKRIMKNK